MLKLERPKRTVQRRLPPGDTSTQRTDAQTVESIKSEQRTAATTVQEAVVPVVQTRKRGIYWSRPRRRALLVLTAVSLIAGRWTIANIAPEIPLPAASASPLKQPNAQHFYVAAVDTLPGVEYSKYNPYSASLAESRAIVSAGRETLRLLRQGVPYTYHPQASNWDSYHEPEYGLSAHVPNLVNHRLMARMLIADARVAVAEGRRWDALSASLDAIKFGQDVGKGQWMVQAMTGELCMGLGVTEGLRLTDGLTADEARAAIDRLSRIQSEERSFAAFVEQERLADYGSAKMIFDLPLFVADRTVRDTVIPQNGIPGAYAGLVFWYGKSGLFQAYTQFMDAAMERVSRPYQVQKSLPPLHPSLPALESVTLSYEKGYRVWTTTATQKRILLARLAVRAFAEEHQGKLPGSLEELTRGATPYLRSVPVDLFSPDGKQTLRYANGTVYSVGENGRDDDNTGDDVAISQPAS